MEKELTQEERISVIRHAHSNSKDITSKQSVEDFIADIKSEAVFAEHGLLDIQKEDLEDESQFLHSDSAENIDEEDQGVGESDEMKEVFRVLALKSDEMRGIYNDS